MARWWQINACINRALMVEKQWQHGSGEKSSTATSGKRLHRRSRRHMSA